MSKSERDKEPLCDIVDHPGDALEQAVACFSGGGLDGPMATAHIIQSEKDADLFESEGVLDVLFIAEDKESGSGEFLLLEQGVKLPLAILQSNFVARVHHPDQSVCALEVVPPVSSDSCLSSHIPYV